MTSEDIECLKLSFLDTLRKNVNRDGLESLIKWLESTDFFTAPASTRFHGNYEGGLCEHSLNVYDALMDISDKYLKSCEYSPETLTIVSLLHDICKADFYKKGTKNVKQPDGRWLAVDVWEVDDKLPLGHGEKSCMLILRHMQLTDEEMLAITWHMGGFDIRTKTGDFSCSRAQDASKLVTALQAADLIAAQLMEETT